MVGAFSLTVMTSVDWVLIFALTTVTLPMPSLVNSSR